MDMSYIMDFADFWLYTTFPNIFSLISVDPAALSKNQKIIFPKKIHDFWIKNVL